MEILAHRYLQFCLSPKWLWIICLSLLQNAVKMFGFTACVVRLVSQIHSLHYSKLRASSLGFAYITASPLVFTIE